ncbi:hypothetical protein KAR91_07315 [Candidatus Pacearchaeota archaeon]|nr:hypothetical protein [Candidatus Pacearchaeota archaeon]
MSAMTEREILSLEKAIALDKEEESKELRRIQLERKINELAKEKQEEKESEKRQYRRQHPALSWYKGG